MAENILPTRRRRPPAGILVFSAVSLAAVVVALARLEIARTPTVTAGTENLRHLWPLWITSGAAWAGLTLLALQLRSHPRGGDRESTRRRASGGSAMLILGVALAARVAVLALHEPALSDDVYRYVFDGRNVAAGINPYLPVPEQRRAILAEGPAAEAWPGEAALLRSINNPELPTIYLPTSQWVFGLAGAMIIEPWTDPARSARVFRAVFVLLELALIALLLGAAHRARRSPWWVALYAWHPLPLVEIAGSGHQDVLGVVLLVAALVVAGGGSRRPVWGWTSLLALATLVKPVALPVAPVLLRRRRPPTWLRSALIGAAVCTAVAAPLWLAHGREPLANLGQTASRFSRKWAHFGSVYEPVLWTIEQATNDPDDWRREPDRADLWSNDQQELLARGVCLALVLTACAAVLLSRLDHWAAARVIFLAMVLFSSTAHPWYLLWALAVMPMAPSPAVWLASLTLPWGYAQLGDVVEWRTPGWVMLLAYVPVYLALCIDLVRQVVGRGGGIEPQRSQRSQRGTFK